MNNMNEIYSPMKIYVVAKVFITENIHLNDLNAISSTPFSLVLEDQSFSQV